MFAFLIYVVFVAAKPQSKQHEDNSMSNVIYPFHEVDDKLKMTGKIVRGGKEMKRYEET
jgi:hypothetical protein